MRWARVPAATCETILPATGNTIKESIIAITYPRFSTHINRLASLLFDLLADMPHYGRWLPDSDAFGGTRDVFPYPVQQGTRYIDYGPAGERHGVVTQFDPPTRLVFHQTMVLRQGMLTAEIDIHILYTLREEHGATLVVRELALDVRMHGWQSLLAPLVRYKFAVENRRILAELKRHAESCGG
jgi:uncharacterized protein YndB with AHSA1/START domain